MDRTSTGSEANGNTFPPMFDDLFAVASETAKELETIWEQVGCNEEERREHLNRLVGGFQQLCKEKIDEERSVRHQFLMNIKQLKEEIEETVQRLGMAPVTVDQEDGNLTDRLADLEERVEEYRGKRMKQEKLVLGTRERILDLLAHLGDPIEPHLEDARDLTNARLEELKITQSHVEREVQRRKTIIVQLVMHCQALLRQLKIDPVLQLDQQILQSLTPPPHPTLTSLASSSTCVGIHSDVVTYLSQRGSELEEERNARMQHLQSLGDQIKVLWDRLKIGDSDRSTFTRSVQGLGLDTLEAGERELRRLVVLKGEMLGSLIAECRSQIQQSWEELTLGSHERQAFAPYHVGAEGYTDDLLGQHEEEVRRLNSRLDVFRPILRMIEKHQEVLRERKEVEQLQKDSKSRLTDRGGKRTEELMRLEKMEARVRSLPMLADRLRKRLLEWERNEGEGDGQAFLFQGTPYLARMDQEEEEWLSYKETQRLEKEAKRREDNEKYKQNNLQSKYTPGAAGNLLPRAGNGATPVSKTPGKKPLPSAPLSAKKGAAAYPPNVPAATPLKAVSACSSISSISSTSSFETPLKSGGARALVAGGPAVAAGIPTSAKKVGNKQFHPTSEAPAISTAPKAAGNEDPQTKEVVEEEANQLHSGAASPASSVSA